MKVKKILFWTLLLTLVATPLLAMERRKPLRRRQNDSDIEQDGEGDPVTETGKNRRDEEILEAATSNDNYLRGNRLPSENGNSLPSSELSQSQNRKKTIYSTNMESITDDRLPSYSSIPSYVPNPEVPKNHGSAGIVQLPQVEGSLRRGIEDGDFTSFSPTRTQLTDHHISIVSASTTHPIDPQRLASIIGKNEKLTVLHKEMLSLEQNYSSQKESIAAEEKQKIEQVKRRAEMTLERTMLAGLPSALAISPNTKKSALQKINDEATFAISVLSFKNEKQFSEIQELRCARLLEKRFIRNATSVVEGAQLDSSLPEARVLKALDLKQRAFDFLGESPETASEEDLGLASQIISHSDDIVAVAFSEGAEEKIGEATLELQKLPDSLSSIAADDLPQQNKFSSHQLIQELQELCHQNHAEFQFAQTVSDQSAGAVAANSADMLFQRAQKLRVDAANGSKQIPFATLQNQQNLSKQVEKFTELASVLEHTALAYDQIADACTVELRAIPQVKEKLAKAQEAFNTGSAAMASDDSGNDLKSQMLADLRALLNTTNLKTPETRETFGLDILSQLKNITGHNEEAVTAFNDKIALAQLSSPFPTDTNRQPYIHGTHLIRLALFREFGSHGLQRFDQRFAANIAAETPIRLGEISEFIAQEETIHNNPSSYFIAEHHSIEELLEIRKDSLEAQKIIKADGSSILSFNPFLNTSTARDALADETGSIQRGIAVAKMTLKSFLEKESTLDPVQIVTILRKFDAAFDASEPGKQLTVGKLKTFTESELKRALAGMTLAEWLSASPRNSGVNSIGWRIVTAGTSAILMSQPHLSPFVKFGILVSEAAISDQTVLWRARSAAPASEGGINSRPSR